jgi:hypothetical protein
MVKLEVVEDEAFLEKPEGSKNGALFQDDDEDFTDTGLPYLLPSSPLTSRLIPPFQTPRSQSPPS